MTGKLADTQRVISVEGEKRMLSEGREAVNFCYGRGTLNIAFPLPQSHTQLVPLPTPAALSVTLNGFLMSLAKQENAHSALPKLHVTATTR